jgi:hypothetical protein
VYSHGPPILTKGPGQTKPGRRSAALDKIAIIGKNGLDFRGGPFP